VRLLVSGSTATVRRLAPCWPGVLGHLLTPANRNAVASLLVTGLPWGADNGAFSGFDPVRYRRFLARVRGQPRCLWVVAPDAVGDARATLALWREWAEEVRAAGQPVAFVGQDGQEDLEVPWEGIDGWFVGGSTRWKLSQAAADLDGEAKRRGKWVHMGRVNSLRRLEVAHARGADSVDGSSFSMYGDKYIDKFCAWTAGLSRQLTLW
jgi:hypothetical protein